MENNAGTQLSPSSKHEPNTVWQGLGLWNLYFLGKFILYWAGYISFDVFYNALFFIALVVPLKRPWLQQSRRVLAIPFGLALLYHDTWFPHFSRLLAQPDIWRFSTDYLFELAGRFFNWKFIVAGAVFFLVYRWLAKRVRLTGFSVLGLLIIGLTSAPMAALPHLYWQAAAQTRHPAIGLAKPLKTADAETPPLFLDDILDDELSNFYDNEAKRHVSFATRGHSSNNGNSKHDFDIIFLNICSLSWADLEEAGLLKHEFLQQLDIVFENFNSATSYSGPAVSRLLKANCGQVPHQQLATQKPQHCSLLGNLRSLGFETGIALNHDGRFQGLIDDLSREKTTFKPLIPSDLPPALRGFDDSPVWKDAQALELWLDKSRQKGHQPTALLYNSISLHDGNRKFDRDGNIKPTAYHTRAKALLNDLQQFIKQLEESDKKVVVVLIPEHGAALKGDRMQIPGMREIPLPEITHVPVGFRFIGLKANTPKTPVKVRENTSFLAVADLLSRLFEQNIFAKSKINWDKLVKNLKETPAVSENEGVVVLQHENKPYVRMQGKNWVEY